MNSTSSQYAFASSTAKNLSSLPQLLDHATPLPGCSGVRSKKKNRSLSYPGHQFRRRVYEGLPDTATNLVTEGR